MRHQLKPKTPSARARMHYILRSDRYGVKADRAAELVAAGVANLPAWAGGPEDFWAAADAFERENSRVCLELELNLPRELSRSGQVAAIADYIDRLSGEAGRFPLTWAVHDSDDGNPHVHLMLQERALDGADRGRQQHFKRANRKKPEQGGIAKSRWWHSRENVFWSRALWADACNRALLREGHAARFDPRKKSERLDEALRAGDLRAAASLCTQTERHEGVRVAAARKKLERGHIEAADLPEPVMQIISGNDAARHYNNWLRDWARTASEKELRLFLADHLHELHQTLGREMHSGHIEARAAWLGQQHAEALAEDAERELGQLLAGEQEHQTAELQELAAVQAECRRVRAEVVQLTRLGVEQGWLEQQHEPAVAAELTRLGWQPAHSLLDAVLASRALAEDAELSALVASEQAHHAADLEHLADRQALARHDARVAQAQARLAALPLFTFDPDPTPEERRADGLEQARAEWLQAHPVRALLGLVPVAVSQDAIDRARREADRARAAAVAAADERQRQIDQLRARLTAWLDRAERQRRERWPGEYQAPVAAEPLHAAQELLGRASGAMTPRDSLRALERIAPHREPDEADDWLEHDPGHKPSSGPRMR